MDGRLIALKLFLDELGVTTQIDSVDDRLRIQKAVYLGQLSGADLGYRYSWYLKGPYSTTLTQDYYALHQALEAGDDSFDSKQLKGQIEKTLKKARLYLGKPVHVPLSKHHWYELLASVHYLRTISGFKQADVASQIKKQKPHLADYIPTAVNHLRSFGLLT